VPACRSAATSFVVLLTGGRSPDGAKRNPGSLNPHYAALHAGYNHRAHERDTMVFPGKKISPCLWFDNRIEQAVNFYVALFGGKILQTSYYGDAGPLPKGTVLTMTFTIHDEEFMALNGGREGQYTDAVSFLVKCKDQAEIDKYWNGLTADGGEEIQCGWCKDKYGVRWQIAPEVMGRLITDKDPARVKRTMEAMFTMKKLDIAALEKAHAGET
jgi:predicted 3-demethylubiquinone-9 3-methyltransferase (glyoxalase superfamily)